MNEGTRRCRAGSASRLRNPDSVTSRTRRRTPSNLVRTYPSATTAVTALIAGYRRGDDVVIAACETGPGRLFFLLEVLRRCPGQALVVADHPLLVGRARRVLAAHLSEPTGAICKGSIAKADSRVIVAAPHSHSLERLAHAAGQFDVCFIDEAAHALVDPTYAAVVAALIARNPKLLVVAITSSPLTLARTQRIARSLGLAEAA